MRTRPARVSRARDAGGAPLSDEEACAIGVKAAREALASMTSADKEVIKALPGCVLAARGVGSILQLHRDLIDRLCAIGKRKEAAEAERARALEQGAIAAQVAGARERAEAALAEAHAALVAAQKSAAAVAARAANAVQPQVQPAVTPVIRRSARQAAAAAAVVSGGAPSGAGGVGSAAASGGAPVMFSRIGTPERERVVAAGTAAKTALRELDLADRLQSEAARRSGEAEATPGASGRRKTQRGGRVAPRSYSGGSDAGAPSSARSRARCWR